MKEIINENRAKFLVDGEDERYATLFESKKAIEDDEIDFDIFGETFDASIDELKFPIITFDNSNASDGWVFEANADKDVILDRAAYYFTKK